MKRFFKITAAVLAAGVATTLAGCSGCAGCNGSSTSLAVTNSNWFTGTNYKGIQPSFIVDVNDENDDNWNYIEDIDYEVTFDSSTATNKTYSVEYDTVNGSYNTKFYAFRYDWRNHKYYTSDNEDKEVLYYYSTEMHVSVQYTFKDGAKSEWFDDSVLSECYFRAAGKSLQPVYSRQEIKSTSPTEIKPKDLTKAYKRIDVVYENFYNRNCTEVKSITREAGKAESEKTFSFKKVKDTLFDNSSLYIAVRSMKLGEDFSQNISLFSPAAGGVSTYTISGTDYPLSTEERNKVSSALTEKGLYTPMENDGGINAVPMNINNVGGNLLGTTQTVWYAAIDNPDNNTARATMLKISIPISFNLGTLNYTLKQVNSTLWNS